MINTQNLQGKVVILINGGKHGAELAVSMARQGADVALAYERGWRQTAVNTRQQIQALGQHCLLIGTTTLDPDVITRIIEYATGVFGKMDIFIDLRTAG
ncbi:MAG: hypothetical protein KDE56_14550 [Anaerolineales bacterium]|nr:hypothetical protein [Anaerolineales bacterium]